MEIMVRLNKRQSQLIDTFPLGPPKTQSFAQSLRGRVKGNAREQAEMKRLQKPVSWAVIVKVIETLRDEKWADLSGRHGDWARDAALQLGQRVGRSRLIEIADLAGVIDYAAVSQSAF